MSRLTQPCLEADFVLELAPSEATNAHGAEYCDCLAGCAIIGEKDGDDWGVFGKMPESISMSIPNHYQLWAKTGEIEGEFHPLVYHMLDVASVALYLWDAALTGALQKELAQGFALSQTECRITLAFLAGLHDIGKASPGFQKKYPAGIPELKRAGFGFDERPGRTPAPHGAVSAWWLEGYLKSEFGVTPESAKNIARVLGGHHGIWVSASQVLTPALGRSDKGGESWEAARQNLTRELEAILSPPRRISLPDEIERKNSLLTLVSGLVSVADWIGSMSNFFPYRRNDIPASQYAEMALRQAEQALHELGWMGWTPKGETIRFDTAFNFSPRPLQKAAIAGSQKAQPPAMLILEAPTGIGKTEAALYMADIWLQGWGGRGLYIAMPTQATSNQMFSRVVRYLRQRYPSELVNVHLINGQARFNREMQALEMQSIADDERDKSQGQVAAMGWFLPRKRSLLAPFGVGTVDQSLMSVLQTRHFFVRLFGLGGKVVVFDEVHAYDTYMSVLFFRLLAWLRVIGASVIILTATLPATTRKQMVCAYLGVKDIELEEADFPRLTVVDKTIVETIPLPAPEEKPFRLEWIGNQAENILGCLKEKLGEGGCAAVICNRVDRAQEIYQAIRDAQLLDPQNLLLFHARFPFAWREAIEKRVLEMFSPQGERPQKAVVVATQVIEQSLDLDFDLIISDMAPADLILQRAGRLHRHRQNDALRPRPLRELSLVIASPTLEAGFPTFGADAFIYEKYILTKSWMCLKSRKEIRPITETRNIIEEVYGEPGALEGGLKEAWDKMVRDREREINLARNKLVGSPLDERLLESMNLGLEEDNPAIHQAFQAMTRLVEPGVEIICLHRVGEEIYLEPDGGGEAIRLEQAPKGETIEELLKRSVSIHHRGIVEYFRDREAPKGWKRLAALKHHLPVVFSDGVYRCEGTGYLLKINRESGVHILKEAE